MDKRHSVSKRGHLCKRASPLKKELEVLIVEGLLWVLLRTSTFILKVMWNPSGFVTGVAVFKLLTDCSAERKDEFVGKQAGVSKNSK